MLSVAICRHSEDSRDAGSYLTPTQYPSWNRFVLCVARYCIL